MRNKNNNNQQQPKSNNNIRKETPRFQFKKLKNYSSTREENREFSIIRIIHNCFMMEKFKRKEQKKRTTINNQQTT